MLIGHRLEMEKVGKGKSILLILVVLSIQIMVLCESLWDLNEDYIQGPSEGAIPCEEDTFLVLEA